MAVVKFYVPLVHMDVGDTFPALASHTQIKLESFAAEALPLTPVCANYAPSRWHPLGATNLGLVSPPLFKPWICLWWTVINYHNGSRYTTVVGETRSLAPKYRGCLSLPLNNIMRRATDGITEMTVVVWIGVSANHRHVCVCQFTLSSLFLRITVMPECRCRVVKFSPTCAC